ncbi:hypothetical protein [Xanthomonas euvesicatoria]|uniref:hypothetical protein n=1 Tax=Xanthomonas euvesicatoria TaxID=456327 RepID=UPI001C484215|nr:hypothetical protein [Xanthomonas euvesicatoria]MBV6829927.1 hypothetical protein [Xanthomonas campestris pv. viegasii]
MSVFSIIPLLVLAVATVLLLSAWRRGQARVGSLQFTSRRLEGDIEFDVSVPVYAHGEDGEREYMDTSERGVSLFGEDFRPVPGQPGRFSATYQDGEDNDAELVVEVVDGRVVPVNINEGACSNRLRVAAS